MLKDDNKITVEQLKTYLNSLENERNKQTKEKIEDYRARCEKNNKKIKSVEVQKIKKAIIKQYKDKVEAKDKIIELLNECDEIPKTIEKLEIARYMTGRTKTKKAENILMKTKKNVIKRYNTIISKIEDELNVFTDLDNIEEIDFSIYKTDKKELEKIKEQYKEDYTEEERRTLIQKELDIVAKAKVFNTTPIPHEILKNCDRDIQSKMQKFNNIRQKRIRILETMEQDYIKLEIPREINAMIDDAIVNIETLSDILTKSEYNKVKNSLIRRRKKVYRSTNEIRNEIKLKERKTGTENYNVQEARYVRMDNLKNIINEANNIIKANPIPGAEESLKKLKVSYEREKQYATVIEQLEEEAGNIAMQNPEVKMLEEQIEGLENKIKNYKKIKQEQEEKIQKTKKELIILWKMEIDSTVSKKKETLEIAETSVVNDSKESKSVNDKVRQGRSFFSKLKKSQGGKHACT